MYINTKKIGKETLKVTLALALLHGISFSWLTFVHYAGEKTAEAATSVMASVGYVPEEIMLQQAFTDVKAPNNEREKDPHRIVAEVCAADGVNPLLARAMMMTESRGDRSAMSRAGAIGLMQIMPENAKWCGLAHPGLLWVPEKNAACGCKLARHLLDKYDLVDALRAYNAGEPRMHKKFPETEAYTRKVMEQFIALLTQEAKA